MPVSNPKVVDNFSIPGFGHIFHWQLGFICCQEVVTGFQLLRRDAISPLVQKDPILCPTKQRGPAAISEGDLPKMVVSETFLDGAAGVDQGGVVPVCVDQGSCLAE